MKKAIISCFLLLSLAVTIEAQSLLKKLQNKIEEEAVEAIFGEDEKKETETKEQPQTNNSANSPTNTRGEGLSAEPADIVASIEAAETSFKGKNYRDARSNIRQAIMDLEIEIGKKVLAELPESVSGLPKIDDEDLVTSTGIGFVGLVINRVYRKDDMEFSLTIGSDAGLLSAANMYMASGMYAAASTEDNQKKITFQDHDALIEFDPDSGYKLVVTFAQSTILVADGVNFNTEKDFMAACSKIDIKKIENQLSK